MSKEGGAPRRRFLSLPWGLRSWEGGELSEGPPKESAGGVLILARSHSEKVAVTCGSCGEKFEVEVWFIIDAVERPDLRQELFEERLNIVSCPRCHEEGVLDVPVLYHDPEREFLFFALPARDLGEADEAELRELLSTILSFLLQSIPEEERKPYLNTIRVVRGLPALAMAVQRAEADWEAERRGGK